jgi:serine/threonine protein phosphatase PrpC
LNTLWSAAAEAIGVFAEPEVSSVQVSAATPFVIIASDGVWEFLSSQRAVDIIAQVPNPLDAAKALVAMAYKAWLQRETRTDDISVIVVYFDADAEGSDAAAE